MRTALLLLLTTCLCLPARAQGTLQTAGPPVALTTPDQNLVQPRWSPDGRLLALTSPGYGGLWVLDRSDGSVRQLTAEPAAGFGVEWSPGGGALLSRVARFDGPRRLNAVKVFDVDTGAARTLVDYRSTMPALPRWSPSGDRVMLPVRDEVEVLKSGLQPAAGKTGGAPVVFAAGSTVAAAVEGDTPQIIDRFDDATILNLVTSPDGTRAAFEVMGGGLYIVPIDGSGRVHLGRGHRPRWSPDGRWVVFQRTEDDGHAFTASDLYAARADGSAEVRLTSTPDRLEMNPDWSPDGRHIAFDALEEGVVYMLPVAE